MSTLDMRNRDAMVASLPHGGVVAEVGVQRGEFADVIVRANEPKELQLIDCWEHQTTADYGHDPANGGDAHHAGNEQFVRDRFSHLPHVKITKSYSVEASKQFADGYFDWVYLDANHLRIRADLEAWYPKVKSGGWVTGHDYCVFEDFIMVQPVLDFYVQEMGVELHVVTEEAFPSWAFRKP